MLSGFSHVRYDHSSRPRVYDVACPKCAARASAHKDSETEMGNVIGDLAGTWHLDDWRITCLSCDYRESDAAYAQLPPPFFRVTSRGTNLWAFNRGHFVMLLRLLDGDPISGDPYEWFATYAHGDWLRKSNRVGLAKQMRRLLESQPATGDNMVFTQGRGFVIGESIGLPRLFALTVCFGLRRRGHRANQFFKVGNIVARLFQPRPADFSARRAELL